MRSSILNIYLLITSLVLITSCNGESSDSQLAINLNRGLEIIPVDIVNCINEQFLWCGSVKMNFGGVDTVVSWRQYTSNNNIRFSTPADWSLHKTDSTQVIFKLPGDKDDFFAFTANKKEGAIMTSDDYVDFLSENLLQGESIIRSKVGYRGNRPIHNLLIASEDADMFNVIVTESDSYVLDFAMKSSVESEGNDRYSLLFPFVMASIQIDGVHVVGSDGIATTIDIKSTK